MGGLTIGADATQNLHIFRRLAQQSLQAENKMFKSTKLSLQIQTSMYKFTKLRLQIQVFKYTFLNDINIY